MEAWARDGISEFQSTRPLRGATSQSSGYLWDAGFQSTRPLRGATPAHRLRKAGGRDFNPRAPCGARLGDVNITRIDLLFQSTRPLRGATSGQYQARGPPSFQSTRPLRGATAICSGVIPNSVFQSTRPLRGATGPLCDYRTDLRISIHAPLAGRDCVRARILRIHNDFNPRAPCGARQQKCTNCFAHFCDNRQVLSKFAQNAACQGILIPFPFRKSLQIWVRTARAISARLRFAL